MRVERSEMKFPELLRKILAITVLATFLGRPSYAESTTPAAKEPDERSSNALIAMSTSLFASANDEADIRRRGLKQGWQGTVYVTFTNVSLGLFQVVDRRWYFDYSVTIIDSKGKAVPPTAQGEKLLKARASEVQTGFTTGSETVAELLPAEAYTDALDLSFVYPIKAGETYTVKIRRIYGLPRKDAAGKEIANPEPVCTLVVNVDDPDQ
jgi:hypothetical protein